MLKEYKFLRYLFIQISSKHDVASDAPNLCGRKYPRVFPATYYYWLLVYSVIIPAPFMWMYSWFVVTGSVCGWECKEKVDT